MYVTINQLIVFFGALEIAQLATPLRYAAISPELLVLAVNEEDTSIYKETEIKAANETLIAINEAISYASSEMDSYFIQKYRLPLSDEILSNNPTIKGFCSDIVRYRLSRNPKQEIKDRYDNSLKWLNNISTGKAGFVEVSLETNIIKKNTLIRQTLSGFNWENY